MSVAVARADEQHLSSTRETNGSVQTAAGRVDTVAGPAALIARVLYVSGRSIGAVTDLAQALSIEASSLKKIV